MTILNNNSICTQCKRLIDCKYQKFMRGDCAYFIDSGKIQEQFLCKMCQNPTTPTGRCRTCSICGETTGCG